jgi:F0F1-type ATP synthase membrane subunit b/b'
MQGMYGRICGHKKGLASSKPRGQSMAETLRQAEANLSKMPYQYRQMVQAAREEAESEPLEILRGGFKPCLPEET